MSAEYFIDTNIFIYAFSPAEADKRRIATGLIREALETRKGAICSQVFQEFVHAALHKASTSIPPATLRAYAEEVLSPLCLVQSSNRLMILALGIQEQSGYRFYDSLIVAAAVEAGVKTLYSEDLQHGRSIGGVRIVNPFTP